jgi:group II intron reverse transcriptase/maturase
MQCAVESAEAMYRKRYVLEADIERFFDTVRHGKLLGMLRREIVDPRVLNLIAGFLMSGCMSQGEGWEVTEEGTPQGGPLSPLLANLYLHYALDERFEKAVQSGGHTKLFRYCDDFIVVTDNHGRLKSVRRALYTWMREAGLKLKEAKTREVDMSNEKRGRSSWLDFLGYRFHLRSFRDNPTRFWIARQPSEKARLALRRNLRQKLRPTLSLTDAKQTAKAVWEGWCGYFRYGNANRVFHREIHSVRKEVFKYLRRKYRHQRRPVPWKRLLPLGKQLMQGLRPVSVISGHPLQGRTMEFA